MTHAVLGVVCAALKKSMRASTLRDFGQPAPRLLPTRVAHKTLVGARIIHPRHHLKMSRIDAFVYPPKCTVEITQRHIAVYDIGRI